MQIQKPKQGYKLVKSLFGKYEEIPDSWKWTKVGNEFELKSGSTPSRNQPEYYQGGIPWVSSGELDYNIINDTKEHISPLAIQRTNLRIYPKGTFLIAITGLEAKGTRGRCAILGIDAATNQSCLAFYKSSTVDTSFFFHFYQLYGERIVFSLAQGTKQQSLNIGLVKSIKFALPHTIEEQQKIASILSNVDSLIQQTQKIIEQTQKLKKGLVEKLLTKGIGHTKFKKTKLGAIPVEWEIVKLREPTSKIGSGVTPLGGSQVYEKDGIPFIRSQNVHFDGLHLVNVAFISTKIHEEMKNTKLYPLDVLLNITGASIGRCTYVPEDFGDGNVNQHVCIIRTTEKLNPIFLTKYLSQDIMQNKINSAQAGLSRQGLTFKEIADFDVVLPPMAEQKKIVSIILNMDTHLNKKAKYKSNLENLKKGLMQKLLTGQIRVKV